jgi:uncharacterized protein (TIGR02391 family)
MPTRRTLPPVEPPSLTPQRAIELIEQKKAEIPKIIEMHRTDPGVDKWVNTTVAILDAALGKPQGGHSDMTRQFRYAHGVTYAGRSDAWYQGEFRKQMLDRQGVLESVVEQLQILAPPIARVADGQYVFHAEIERVSGLLFRDGHYKQAALEAFIRVIEEVKVRSGIPLDGDKLMNQAFSFDPNANRMPVLRFNPMSNDAERDEQTGFLFLFKGLVMHRNFKAHSNQLFNDPLRAHDYLSFASLLMRVLELSEKTVP